MTNEKGQGVIEYAIILVLVAIMVIVILATCLWLPVLIAVLFGFWAPISAWGTALVAGVMALNPAAIFVAVVILVILAIVIFNRRRS